MMHPTNWTCCTEGQSTPWWIWLILAVIALGAVARIIWVWWRGDFRRGAVASRETDAEAQAVSHPEAWARARADRPRNIARPNDVPVPESVEEVALWAGSEDMRRTEFVAAPLFWVLLPLAALGFLIWGVITAPGDGWTGNLFDDESSGQPWNFWLVWVAVVIWLLIAVGVLLLRLRAFDGLRAENQWIFEHGIAYSIHRASVDADDGEASGWATYIALDHRCADAQAARIHEAFEEWLRTEGMPPSGSEPIASETLFGAQAKGGYFLRHLPVSQTAGATAEQRWMLITPEHDGEGGVIVTPVPAEKQFPRMRTRARRKAARKPGDGPARSTSTEIVRMRS